MFLKNLAFAFLIFFIFENCPIGERLKPSQSECKKNYQQELAGLAFLLNKPTTKDSKFADMSLLFLLNTTQIYKSCMASAKAANDK
ncbi:MAG: hypothetical protein IT569_09010 [Leptospiraceae bacterium]|nr:hypothetical protein [Leptospiraceae bacterium]